MDYLLGNTRAVILQSALMFRELVPYVLVGAAFGAALRCRERVVWLDRVLSLPRAVVTLSAALLGTVSPLCTMGTVPLLAGLAGRGFPAGAVIAFLAASSMVNPQLLVLTVGTVGVPLALARWAGAVGVGVSAGWLVTVAERGGWRVRAGRFASAEEAEHQKQSRGFWHYFLDHLEFVALHLLFGVILAAMVNVFLPTRYLVRWLGPESRFAVVMSALVAIPFYVCGGGILPTMQVLMEKGIPAGVVLAFFISGPATRIQALAALSAVLSRRALIVYVVLVLSWAVFLGVVANRITTGAAPG